MNRKQRRSTKAQNPQAVRMEHRGKTYSIDEAGALAIAAQNAGNYLEAIALYDRILAQLPDYAEVYNNRGAALEKLGRYQEALASYDMAIARKPGNGEAHNNRGIALQELQRYDESLTAFAEALRLKPDTADIYNNQGVTLQKMERYGDALACYEHAISLQPGYAEAHNNRSIVLQQLHRDAEGLLSSEAAIALRPGYAEAHNSRAGTLQKLQRYDEALLSCDQAIALKPGYAEAYNNRGNILLGLKRYTEALGAYDHAISLKADYAEAYSNRGVTLQEMRLYEQALTSCDKAIEINPNYANAHNSRATVLQKMKRYDEALASAEKAIALKPDYAGAYQNRGLILVNKGEMAEAENMFRKALALKPDFADPLSSLIHIRAYGSAEHADVQALKEQLAKPDLHADDREYLLFALGKIYDDTGQFDDAFACYRDANTLRNRHAHYDAAMVDTYTRRICEIFSKEFLAQQFAFASSDTTPVFIVGMPRSGTTLLASILSNHPEVASAGELPTLAELTSALPAIVGHKESAYPDAVQFLDAKTAQHCIETYITRLRRDAREKIPYVIDKHPLNFRHLGLIAMLWPKAKILHTTRHALDIVLSNYFQRFTLYYDYAFDLQNIAHFYRAYEKLMVHWQKVLPAGMMQEVRYEDMVRSTEQVARAALGFLQLPWDERCLAPHTNPHPVETASQWQVRQPIYTQSLDRWKHYEKFLASVRV